MNTPVLLQQMSKAAAEHSENFLKDNIMKKWYALIDNSNIGNE